MATKDPPEQAPGTDDALQLPDKRAPGFSRGPGAVCLNNFIKAMNAAGDDADSNYQAALRDLLRNSDEVMVAIAERFGACSDRDFPHRRALVYAAAQLQSPVSLPFLRSLVLSPIPPEQSPAPHSFSTVGQETILRTTAVEAVGFLARKRRGKALDALFEFLAISSISIRRAAVQSLLAVDKRLRNRIAECLPKDARYLLDIVPKKVRDVPQIKNPKRHLRKQLAKKADPPRLEDEDYDLRQPGKSPRLRK